MENIYLHGTILGMTRKEIEKKLDQIIAFSGLEEFIDTPVKRYSSGMYARLGFSIAAHVDPEVLIVDEVLSVGDFAFQQRCMDRMRSAIEAGTTLLFVSHNLKSVTEICQRALLLEHGKMTAIGDYRCRRPALSEHQGGIRQKRQGQAHYHHSGTSTRPGGRASYFRVRAGGLGGC